MIHETHYVSRIPFFSILILVMLISFFVARLLICPLLVLSYLLHVKYIKPYEHNEKQKFVLNLFQRLTLRNPNFSNMQTIQWPKTTSFFIVDGVLNLQHENRVLTSHYLSSYSSFVKQPKPPQPPKQYPSPYCSTQSWPHHRPAKQFGTAQPQTQQEVLSLYPHHNQHKPNFAESQLNQQIMQATFLQASLNSSSLPPPDYQTAMQEGRNHRKRQLEK